MMKDKKEKHFTALAKREQMAKKMMKSGKPLKEIEEYFKRYKKGETTY